MAQITVAAGMLKLIDLKPRTIGALGIIASAVNLYQITPPLPAKPKKA